MWEASRFGSIETLKNISDNEGISVLSKRHPTPQYLIQQAKEEAQWKNSKGQQHQINIKGGHWTPLHIASAFGNIETAKYLLEMNVCADQKDTYPRDQLNNEESSFKNKKNKKKENTNNCGWNALHWASHTANLQLIKELLPYTTLTQATRKTLCSILQYTTTKQSKNQTNQTTKHLETWGSGVYFNLGNGTSNTRNTPYRVFGKLLIFFSFKFPLITQT